jgi:hypothetical protein
MLGKQPAIRVAYRIITPYDYMPLEYIMPCAVSIETGQRNGKGGF